MVSASRSRPAGDRGRSGALADPDQIKAEIEPTREQLARTVDELAARSAGRRPGGTVSGVIFKQVRKRVADQEDAPGALQSECWRREVVLAGPFRPRSSPPPRPSDRAGGRGFSKLNGTWLGD